MRERTTYSIALNELAHRWLLFVGEVSTARAKAVAALISGESSVQSSGASDCAVEGRAGENE
jgi:hypothetical protein